MTMIMHGDVPESTKNSHMSAFKNFATNNFVNSANPNATGMSFNRSASNRSLGAVANIDVSLTDQDAMSLGGLNARSSIKKGKTKVNPSALPDLDLDSRASDGADDDKVDWENIDLEGARVEQLSKRNSVQNSQRNENITPALENVKRQDTEGNSVDSF